MLIGVLNALVELSDRSSEISKKLFKNFAPNFDDHKFLIPPFLTTKRRGKKYDIVHCVGVLSHTCKRKGIQKNLFIFKTRWISYFGDPNKSGGFQNMLQRYALYKYSKDDEELLIQNTI